MGVNSGERTEPWQIENIHTQELGHVAQRALSEAPRQQHLLCPSGLSHSKYGHDDTTPATAKSCVEVSIQLDPPPVLRRHSGGTSMGVWRHQRFILVVQNRVGGWGGGKGV